MDDVGGSARATAAHSAAARSSRSRAIWLSPRAIALELLSTGPALSAEDALRWGLVNRVVPRADLERKMTGAPMDTWDTEEGRALRDLTRRSITEHVVT